MKALKLTLVTLILLSAVTAFSNQAYFEKESKRPVKCVKISLKEAIKDPVLVWNMYNQLDNSFLMTENQGTYTKTVIYNGALYFITGTHDEWVLFFVMDYTGPKVDLQRMKASTQ
jgi:hypothetical protein